MVYDGEIALFTPMNLWTSTGIRSLDHAVELLYHPLASEIPTKALALSSISMLFSLLPACKADPTDADIRQKLFLACYASLFPFLYTGGVGLSHSIGHALGATYGIPHGITSCLTLAPTLALKAKTKPEEAKQVARILPVIGEKSTGSVQGDAELVSKRVAELVEGLGHKSTLTQVGYMIFLASVKWSWRESRKLTMNSTKSRLERKRVLLFMRLWVAKDIRISRTVSFATIARI